ncbi:hypothetical protein [Fulvivirga sediminis]|uniref:Uncharacterized protein n=1 Tax=Fulvivirga sediminis TaxID=2803949 RepID=A0A937FAS6_9BACT|nr:hypothetical protein [Fulvivirga sediminis]MBL3657764.1 hypothetical protein [Fulvivirga sediminis]
MKKAITQYLVGVAMLLFAIYQIYRQDYWEFSLYITAGMAFIVMGLIKNKALPVGYSRLLNSVSWILIIMAGLLFLFLIQTES